MKSTITRILCLALIAVMLLGVVACSNGDANTNNGGNTADKGSTNSSADKGSSDKKDDAAAKRDDINIYCEGVWSTIDPHGTGATAYVNMYIINQAYEALVKVEQDGSITPVLATDWTISEDGLTYDFNIRQGVKFHNGEELKASDVVYSVNRAMSMPSLESYYSYIASVEATGDYAYYSDMESWMHLNCFFRELDKKVNYITANFNGPDRSRAEESIDAIAAMRGLTVVVTENEDYPLPANVRRIVIPAAEYDWLSPLLNYLPMALMAGYLCEIKHEAYGRGGRDDWAATATTTLLTNSKIVIV